jgi:hypothetical protein
MFGHLVWQKFRDVLKELAESIMEAASTSETSVNVCQTARLNISENNPLHIVRQERLNPKNLNL